MNWAKDGIFHLGANLSSFFLLLQIALFNINILWAICAILYFLLAIFKKLKSNVWN